MADTSLLPVLREIAPSRGGSADGRAASGMAAAEEVDERGDSIFHFRLKPLENANDLEVSEMLRQTVLDVLQLVKFYSDGKPVIIDSFAFLNEPEKRIQLLTGKAEC